MEKQFTLSSRARIAFAVFAAVAAAVATRPAHAADWSDTSIGYRYGTKFAEPYNPSDITKNIFNLTHVSGFKYGTNFFNVDMLMSDSKDPDATGAGAQEVYVVYRNTLEYGKIFGTPLKGWGIRDWGLNWGFDFNTKNDAGYSSKKRMFVIGPNASWDVPGFLNSAVLLLDESNAPVGHPDRYHYKDHAALSMNWGIPLGDWPVAYEGFFLWIGAKGMNEFGGPTVPETNWDSQVMLDIGKVMGGAKGTWKVGFEYQYWRNKFGNDHNGPAGQGAFAKTPMIRGEYHF
jgi:hypothetical protein